MKANQGDRDQEGVVQGTRQWVKKGKELATRLGARVWHEDDGSNGGVITSEKWQKHQLLVARILPVLALLR